MKPTLSEVDPWKANWINTLREKARSHAKIKYTQPIIIQLNEADDIALKYVQQIIDDKIDKPISDIVAFVSGIQFLYWNLFGDILVSKDNISTKTLLDVLKECNANANKGSLKYLAAIAEELRDQPASMLLETIVALQWWMFTIAYSQKTKEEAS